PVPSVQSLPSMFDTLPAPTRFKPEWLPSVSAVKAKQGFEFEGQLVENSDKCSCFFCRFFVGL
ncbi:hypothetical protein, partial [Colwellia sp. MB3u-70]|uniref:hypothetical protein n=1 Tax=Colwellia sp. MB3u-70 TaxID=2759819 RepID=UPI001C7104AE